MRHLGCLPLCWAPLPCTAPTAASLGGPGCLPMLENSLGASLAVAHACPVLCRDAARLDSVAQRLQAEAALRAGGVRAGEAGWGRSVQHADAVGLPHNAWHRARQTAQAGRCNGWQRLLMLPEVRCAYSCSQGPDVWKRLCSSRNYRSVWGTIESPKEWPACAGMSTTRGSPSSCRCWGSRWVAGCGWLCLALVGVMSWSAGSGIGPGQMQGQMECWV